MTESEPSATMAAIDWDSAFSIDARGQPCPQPLLAMRRTLRQLPPGTLLHVMATDPGSEQDFRSFSRLSGVPLVRVERNGDEYHYWLRATTPAGKEMHRQEIQ